MGNIYKFRNDLLGNKMKNNLLWKVYFILFVFVASCKRDNPPSPGSNDPSENHYLYLRKAYGGLIVSQKADTDTIEIYFHIPIAFAEQVPIYCTVECPDMLDYRFIRLDPINVIAVARLKNTDSTVVKWNSWVIMKEQQIKESDIPDSLEIPASASDYPEEVRKWLQSSDCVQIDAPIVQEKAAWVRSRAKGIKDLGFIINDLVMTIPFTFNHQPKGFDAVYALNWGNSCTGHAHAAAALFRANNVPARNLLNVTCLFNQLQDMHWIIDYYINGYGWVKMETSMGENYCQPKDEIVTMVAEPGHENPFYYPGIEGMWHSSNPELGIRNPKWGRAHTSYQLLDIRSTVEKINSVFAISQEVNEFLINRQGIRLSAEQKNALETGKKLQADALERIEGSNLDGFIEAMTNAKKEYQKIKLEQEQTIFFDNFEKGVGGWTHGGVFDEWELGTPTYGATSVFSGNYCWGTDLDENYENCADNWLMSPVINLENLVTATLSIRIWNWVEDGSQGVVIDPLWVEITTDGENYVPLCSKMGGVNDDPEIPGIGGWNHLVLDMNKYIGQNVQVRFRFKSDNQINQPGSFIDDFRILGRRPGF